LELVKILIAPFGPAAQFLGQGFYRRQFVRRQAQDFLSNNMRDQEAKPILVKQNR
jgi:hypothetical protein